MDGTRLGNRRGVGSVKDAVNLFDERLAGTDDAPSLKPPSRTRELHKVKNDIGRYKESRWTAESAKARAESELSNAKKTVKSLSSLIEESSNKAKMQMRDIETLEKRRKNQNGALVVKRNEHHEYANVMRELECVKRDLFKLKLDVASVLEQKSRAEKEFEESSSKIINCSRTAEGLRKEIEEANEEQVLAELARIEALKELEEIEAQRRKEANEHEAKLESMRKKMKEAIAEIEESKELEKKLAVTMSDVELLQNELNSVKENEKRAKGDEGIKQFEAGFAKEEESEGTAMMSKNIKEELEAAKKELALIKEEGFQFMVSMDVIRNELNHVTAETVRLKKEEGKVDSTVLNLNSKFLRAKSKLEAVSAAEQKAKSILMSLTHTLDNLKTERDDAKKEKDLISQEVTATSAEIQKIESEIDITEERLRDAMQELEVAKTSEALALEKLKTLAENTMRERASSSQHGSVITISKFEYEYLTNHASAAEEIADKKVEAAQAWIEAFKASEREILMKTKIAQKELKETKLMEKQAEEKFLARRVSSEEFENWPRKRERSNSKNFQRAMSRRSFKSNGSITPARRMKFQKSSSPATRLVSPFPVKARKKVIPNFAKFFRGKKNTKTTK
ncbi:hypothetical protein HN51_068197 [Arachis hypogaea]|nr:protein PLASTID MOVEMENT IMPAIRED 2 [Arachis ipaensis]XP_025650481.1 protein PLASTID MOVEMENT IMPAIRED 2-like [Arachis hypogaea]XP_025697213.1 protein PLASTID MOVEMENT IMPAIRED 2-like [Arachis hypogaea]QHO09769.1 Protein PLASTID MOVEMENT IMPAIRED [Arachis hypogaea]QHO09770.1 Protein PLASTID MOVEMENT IMPAIRED [Arachis hypogaea]